jgi:cytochrome b subunit of formate dehydrogenase
MTCGRCHGDLRLADKYGIKAGQVSSYEDSYHGLASRSGKLTVAHCGSCHGVHGILPSSNPDSPINEEHLAETCGRCHPGAGSVFPIGKVHVDEGDSEHAVIDWVRNLYVLLIFVTIGGMLLHNVLDLYRKTRAPRPAALTVGGPLRLRMLPGFRAAHILMMMSFAVLAWTGFALTYPEAWWARPLLLWEESFSLRGWLHRGAAVVMILSIAVHLAHLMTSRAARKCIAKMRPSLHDVTELRERILWFVGRRADPPPAPELGYPEKMEYIALMWGVLVMAVTGGALWFENVVLRWLPKWTADLATVIHFYEGVLASLAILVWHFYFVIFDPVVYPMDAAWLTGRSHPGRVLERRASEVRSRPPHLPEPMPSGDPPLPEDGAAPQPPGRPPGPSPHST